MPGIQIGQILVEQGILTEDQVRQILRIQQTSHRPFGDLAERLFGISPSAIEDAWVEQYVRMAGVVNLERIGVDEECLRVINRRQAWQFHMLPARRSGNALEIATDAEHLIRAINFTTHRLHEPVYFQIAPREQLHDFLMQHYPVPKHMAAFAESM